MGVGFLDQKSKTEFFPLGLRKGIQRSIRGNEGLTKALVTSDGGVRFSIERGVQHQQYLWAGICVSVFLAAQVFQEIAYRFWIPAARTAPEELLIYLNSFDKARALAVMAGIVVLLVPYAVLALRYFRMRPVLSMMGLLFGAAFVGFEVAHRSLDFFVVGGTWARQLQSVSDPGIRDEILKKFAVWSEGVHGWYFPLLMSHLLASCIFAVLTASEWSQGIWSRLATVAFALNAVRLLGRALSMFGGWKWLDPLNDWLYFPAVFVINAMLAAWFFFLTQQRDESSSYRP